MDDSILSDLPTSQGSSQEEPAASTSRNPNTRFAGATSTSKNQFNTRDLFDETLDLGAAGTTDIPDEDSRSMQIPRQYGALVNREYTTNGTRLPLDEMERMDLHDKAQGSATAASGGTASSTSNALHQTTYQPESGLGRKDQENAEDDLPTVPPLSAEERRTQALTRERDDLAKMNTLLEAAIASITRAVPKMENFQSTMNKTHALLDTYTKVLSQAEHTQSLLLDGSWDPQRDEDEIREAAEAEERRQREEEERIAREQREAEEKELKLRQEAERKATIATGRGRGVPVRGTRSVPSSRVRASGTARGTVRGTARGRGTFTAREPPRS